MMVDIRKSIRKARIVLGVVSNWYMLPIDKLGLAKHVTYRFRNGASLRCRTRSSDINEACVVFSGLEYRLEQCRLGQDSVVVDLGGNIGAFTIWLAAINPDVRIYSYVFEPHPGNAALIRENLALNGVDDCEVIEAAVSGQNGTAWFDVAGSFDAFKLTKNGTLKVETLKLSSFVNERDIRKVDIIKMDVEGAEYEIINEDIHEISKFVDKILIEFHEPIYSDNTQKMVGNLKEYFEVDVIDVKIGGGIMACRKFSH